MPEQENQILEEWTRHRKLQSHLMEKLEKLNPEGFIFENKERGKFYNPYRSIYSKSKKVKIRFG